jgi:peptide-methionine (S)-S-oxide reductase
MFRRALVAAPFFAGLAWYLAPDRSRAENAPRLLPAPATDVPAASGTQTAIFAGGCFWGVQAVFQHSRGVIQAVSGYAGGKIAEPSYEQVSTGRTGHAEAVRITFDPARISYGALLRIFFSVAHDPTQKDRQGPDWGTQYRSHIFAADADQARVARAYIAQLDAAHSFDAPIVTRVDDAMPFHAAETYHQDYLELHPNQPYIAMYDMPKLRSLQALFPGVWQDKPVTVGKLAAGM